MKSRSIQDQVIASIVNDDNLTATQANAKADEAMELACERVERVRQFVADTEHILGSEQTKHGEIAEHIDTEIGNARLIMEGLSPNRSIDVGRLAPEDYLIGDHQVQSKFYETANGSLGAVIEHSEKYPDFVSEGGLYQIPKDQYTLIEQIAHGEHPDNIDPRTIEAIKEKIEIFENATGEPIDKTISPSLANYEDVQLDHVNETLDNYESELSDLGNDSPISLDPLDGAAISSGVGVAIAGTASAAFKIYNKMKSGKKLSRFTLDDWKEIGYDFGKNGLKGGVSGVSIYELTSLVDMSAPLAGAVTSSVIGIATLSQKYHKGDLSSDEFTQDAMAICTDAGIAALGSALGQTIIPIPIIGAVIGSTIARVGLSITKEYLRDNDSDLLEKVEAECDSTLMHMTDDCRRIVNDVENYINSFGGMMEVAFNHDANMSLKASVELAQALGVDDSKIIHNIEDLDRLLG